MTGHLLPDHSLSFECHAAKDRGSVRASSQVWPPRCADNCNDPLKLVLGLLLRNRPSFGNSGLIVSIAGNSSPFEHLRGICVPYTVELSRRNTRQRPEETIF
jgi:hypothetical protein